MSALHEFRYRLGHNQNAYSPGRGCAEGAEARRCLERCFRTTVEQSPELPYQPFLSRCHLGAPKNDAARAHAAYENALELKPDYAQVQSSLGCSTGRRMIAGRALEEFRQAVMSDPDLAEAHYNLGLVAGQIAASRRSHSRTERSHQPRCQIHGCADTTRIGP